MGFSLAVASSLHRAGRHGVAHSYTLSRDHDLAPGLCQLLSSAGQPVTEALRQAADQRKAPSRRPKCLVKTKDYSKMTLEDLDRMEKQAEQRGMLHKGKPEDQGPVAQFLKNLCETFIPRGPVLFAIRSEKDLRRPNQVGLQKKVSNCLTFFERRSQKHKRPK